MGNELFPYKGIIAATGTELGKEGAIEAANNSASKIAGIWYHFTDARFTAWGKYSKVLVPKATPIVKTAIQGLNGVSWATTDYELASAINTCSGTL